MDSSLYEAYQDIPVHMKVYGGKNRSDTSNLQLESMYHRGMCTLHRKFVTKGRLDPRYELSRDRCISSALALLSLQNILDPSWYKFAHTRQMLTLAAMIVFLELEHRRRDPDMERTSSDSGALLQALEKSCDFWAVAKSSCDEACRIYHILAGMLSSFHTIAGTSSSGTQTSEPLFGFPGLSTQFPPTHSSLSLEKESCVMSNEMDIDWVGSPLSYYLRYTDEGTGYMGRVHRPRQL